jgi:hypothetical protein
MLDVENCKEEGVERKRSMPPSFMNGPAYVFHWQVFSIDIYISAANLIVICLMILVFILALVVPFPRGGTAR